jgi:lycopene cyclase domain-containing protein
MNFGHYSYLASTVIFAGGAVAILWIVKFQLLSKYTRLILSVGLLGMVLGVIGEAIALRIGAWAYNSERTVDRAILGVPIETYLFSLLISIAIASAAINWADSEDRGKPMFSRIRRKLRMRFKNGR